MCRWFDSAPGHQIDQLIFPMGFSLRPCGNSSVGRAIPCQGIGREFEPLFPLQVFEKGSKCFPFLSEFFGAIANRLCNGLQIRLARFDSGSRLQFSRSISSGKASQSKFVRLFCLTIHPCPSGEIGRHIGLKIRRFVNNGRTGSIPVSGTI